MNRKMKYSGIEWIGEVPIGWNIVKLKIICEIYTGNSISDDLKDRYTNNSEAYPYIATKDLDVISKSINYENGLYVKRDDSSFKIAKKRSALLCIEGGSAGRKVAFTNQDVAFVNKLCCLKSNKSNTKFIYYYLNSPAFIEQFNLNLSGLIGGVSITTLKQINCPLPSSKEQQKIVGYLDKKVFEIDNIINKTTLSIKEYKKYKQSVITEAVTKGLNQEVEMKDSGIEWIGEIPEKWNVLKLKNIIKSSLQYGANESGCDFDDDLPRYIRITDITTDNKLKTNGKLALSFEKAKQFILEEGDILFARSGATVGKTFIYKAEYGICAFAGYLIKASININVLPMFVYYYTLSYAYNQWKNSIFIQSTIQNIGADKYSNMEIPIPFIIEEQHVIVDYLDKKCGEVDNLITQKLHLLTELESYKKSLIYECVTGKREAD